MEFMDLLVGAGSAASGGAIGALANLGMAWLGNRRNEKKDAHELRAMRERRETMELTSTSEERMAVLQADAAALSASVQASVEESKTLQHQSLPRVASGLLAFAEFFKMITRPGLTWYLVVYTTLVAHGAVDAGITDNPYLHAMLSLTGAAVGWWFSARPIAMAMRPRT